MSKRNDGKGGLAAPSLEQQATGEILISKTKLRLNPLFVCWLMNFPLGWVDLAPLASTNYVRWATQSCRWLRPTPS